MFLDWLTIEQDFGFELPIMGNVVYQRIHIDSGEAGAVSQPVLKHAGSFCDVVSIFIRGSVLKMSGNPSRWGRVDNLFGLPTVDACVYVYNAILRSLELPIFTRCTKLQHRQAGENERGGLVSNGALIKELHITSNRFVGRNNEDAYISGLSTLPYRNSLPRLHSNGKSVDWLSKRGNAHLIYPTVYNKAHELQLHALNKLINRFGECSHEVNYLKKIMDYCITNGVVRFEQKLKSRFLQKNNLMYWGISDFGTLNKLHDDFISIDKKLMVTAMDFDTISDFLIKEGVVDSIRSANTTAMYAIQWMHGHFFDFNKKQVQVHRARLRKIGIDIAQRCNVSKFTPVFVRNSREIVVSDAEIPDWYIRPNHLRVA